MTQFKPGEWVYYKYHTDAQYRVDCHHERVKDTEYRNESDDKINNDSELYEVGGLGLVAAEHLTLVSRGSDQ